MNPGYHRSTMRGTGGSFFSQRPYCNDCPIIPTSFFSALNGPSKSALHCLMEYGRYIPRQVLYQEGNPATRIYSIKTGFVKTYRTHPLGKDQLIQVAKAGDIINLESLSSGRCTATAEVLADSEICFFEVRRLMEMAKRSSVLALELMRLMSASVAESQQRILDLGTRDAKSRLAVFLLDMVPVIQNGANGNGSHRNGRKAASNFQLPLTRHEIADLIGVRLETISRLFQQFKSGGLLEVDRRHVTLRDIPGLREIAR